MLPKLGTKKGAAQHCGKEHTTLRRLKTEGNGGGWLLELGSGQPGVSAQGTVGPFRTKGPINGIEARSAWIWEGAGQGTAASQEVCVAADRTKYHHMLEANTELQILAGLCVAISDCHNG